MAKTWLLGSIAGIAMLCGATEAAAQPYPGCPFETHTIYSVCSDDPGVPGVTPGFSLTPGVPGTFGPQGIYTPMQDSPTAKGEM